MSLPSGAGKGSTDDGALEACIRFSRRLGADPSLVLHGGGNTSVKTSLLVGDQREEIVHVKSSGHDLATIDARGFSPLRRRALLDLLGRPSLGDVEMVEAFRAACIDPSAASASIEAILHALLPGKYVFHTHADAVVTLTNSPLTDQALRDVLGGSVVVLPYCRPGWDLAVAVGKVLDNLHGEAHPDSGAVVLRHHGLFTYGPTAEETYLHHTRLIAKAESHIDRARGASPWPAAAVRLQTFGEAGAPSLDGYADLRRQLSKQAGFPVLLHREMDDLIERFLSLPDVGATVGRGTITMEHVIRIKHRPLVGRDVANFARAYRSRFRHFAAGFPVPLRMLDPAPRVVLDPELGCIAVGRTLKELRVVSDIYRHTMKVMLDAESLGGFRSITAQELFDIEYWELEQAKLLRQTPLPTWTGMVSVVLHKDEDASSELGRLLGEALYGLGAQTLTHAVEATEDLDGALRASTREAVAEFGGVDRVFVIDAPAPLTTGPRDMVGVEPDGSPSQVRPVYLRMSEPGVLERLSPNPRSWAVPTTDVAQLARLLRDDEVDHGCTEHTSPAD